MKEVLICSSEGWERVCRVMEGQGPRNSFCPVMGKFYPLYLNLSISNGCQEHCWVNDSEGSAGISRKEPQLIGYVCYKHCIDAWWSMCHVESPHLVQLFYFTFNKAKVLVGEDNQSHTDGQWISQESNSDYPIQCNSFTIHLSNKSQNIFICL